MSVSSIHNASSVGTLYEKNENTLRSSRIVSLTQCCAQLGLQWNEISDIRTLQPTAAPIRFAWKRILNSYDAQSTRHLPTKGSFHFSLNNIEHWKIGAIFCYFLYKHCVAANNFINCVLILSAFLRITFCSIKRIVLVRKQILTNQIALLKKVKEWIKISNNITNNSYSIPKRKLRTGQPLLKERPQRPNIKVSHFVQALNERVATENPHVIVNQIPYAIQRWFTTITLGTEGLKSPNLLNTLYFVSFVRPRMWLLRKGALR